MSDGLRQRHVQVLLGLMGLAALVRFSTLGEQSLWADEGFTAQIARKPLGEALDQIPRTESTPPVYYVLMWGWEKLFGHSAFALRSPSALIGVLTVPFVYLGGAALATRRVGLLAAALVAVAPLIVWYSQEARAYSLLLLLISLGFWCFARALHRPDSKWLIGWAAASAVAIATHYFAIFAVATEALWLLLRAADRRKAWLAVLAPAATVLALVPLIAYQQDHVPRPWTDAYALKDQTLATAQHLLVGMTWNEPIHRGGVLLLTALLGFALYLLARRGSPGERRAALVPIVVAVVALGAPLAISLVGTNYLAPRNVLPGWPMLAIAIAMGAGARRAGRAGVAAVTAACVVCLAIDVWVAADRDLQRDDWRGLVAALGPNREPRAVVVVNAFENERVVRYYLGQSRRPVRPGAVREIAVMGRPAEVPATFSRPPEPGMRQVEYRETRTLALVRWRSSAPVRFDPDAYTRASDVLLLDLPGPPAARR